MTLLTSSLPANFRAWACAAASVAALALGPSSAQAIGFEGYYAFDNWTQITPGDSWIEDNTAANPSSVTLWNATGPSNTDLYTFFLIRAQAAGNFGFHWEFESLESNSNFSNGGYEVVYSGAALPTLAQLLVGKVLAANNAATPGDLSVNIEDKPAQGGLPWIGFFIYEATGRDGLMTISNLDAPVPTGPNPTPEPSSLALLTLGAVGLRRAQQRRMTI